MSQASPLAKPNSSHTDTLAIALVGNPNTGKSTLFSALCGVHARIGNFPGVTVEKKIGHYRDDIGEVTVIDLPGTYSLSPRSLDELVSVEVLLGQLPDVPALGAVVVIVDACNLERNLYLLSQVREIGLPIILVLNMWDRAQAEGVKIDLPELERRLGVTVATTSAQRRLGIPELKKIIRTATQSPLPPDAAVFPEVFQEACTDLSAWMAQRGDSNVPRFMLERLLLDTGGAAQQRWKKPGFEGLEDWLTDRRKTLAENQCRVPMIETTVRYRWVRQQLDGIHVRPENSEDSWSDKIDRVLTHWIYGIAIFALTMFMIFQAIYQWAGPFMDAVETVQMWVAGIIESQLAPGALRSLLVDGVISGVGSVIIFLPQILILFLFIGILEDCGYMARAAFVMDRAMTRIGLSGKSFVPLMSSFACAIPGVMATRTIENRRDRMVTILIAPLMSCSARLPVYLLMIAAFVPAMSFAGGWLGLQGLILFAMHLLGLAVAIPVALILKRTFFKGETPPFVMELPPYKWPSLRVVLFRVWERGQAFLVRAGTLIFWTSILIWGAGYFPSSHKEEIAIQKELESIAALPESEQETQGERVEELESRLRAESGRLIESSFLGMAGKGIEPIVRPLGWDWKIGVGVIASFPAREVVIATLGTIYSLGGDVDSEDQTLIDTIRSARWPDGSPVYNLPVALSIMVFFALCAQCAATLMVIRRETNSWRWPLFTFTYMTVLAYIGAFLTYQIGMLFM